MSHSKEEPNHYQSFLSAKLVIPMHGM